MSKPILNQRVIDIESEIAKLDKAMDESVSEICDKLLEESRIKLVIEREKLRSDYRIKLWKWGYKGPMKMRFKGKIDE